MAPVPVALKGFWAEPIWQEFSTELARFMSEKLIDCAKISNLYTKDHIWAQSVRKTRNVCWKDKVICIWNVIMHTWPDENWKYLVIVLFIGKIELQIYPNSGWPPAHAAIRAVLYDVPFHSSPQSFKGRSLHRRVPFCVISPSVLDGGTYGNNWCLTFLDKLNFSWFQILFGCVHMLQSEWRSELYRLRRS